MYLLDIRPLNIFIYSHIESVMDLNITQTMCLTKH